MLTAYETQTRRLLQNPQAPTALYSDVDIISWINTARGQLAGEGECIRYMATVSTVAGQQEYQFSALDTGTSATNGIDGIINVRALWFGLGTGRKWVPPRPWEWFSLYYLNNLTPAQSFPTTWTQFGQGAAPGTSGATGGGSFYLGPVPDQAYTLYLDCVCYPIALVDDTTVEAIPYLWTDAVPYYAAYLALLSAQTNSRMADAERYFNMYTEFVTRARKFANPATGRWQYSQATDPAQAAKMGVKVGGG